MTCVSIYALSVLTGIDDVSPVCLSPHALVQRFQLYRQDLSLCPAHMTCRPDRSASDRCTAHKLHDISVAQYMRYMLCWQYSTCTVATLVLGLAGSICA